ncbi:MAG: GNAT family N-acetyltransferase [Defluviitaleaceae bacterium]|nr:GNAT family N-acetyltransferase [Defluviitaleaceae bacterium]
MGNLHNSNFKLKQYEPEYINICVELFFDVFTDEPFNFQITADNMTRYLTDISNSPNFKGYMYFMGKRLIGICFGAFIDYFQVNTYDIKEVAVAKDCQGSGIGGAFLNEIEKDLAKSGVKAVTLATQKTIPAFGFYKKNGYSISDNTVYMSKSL